ncbi:MAG: GatB/YqeY domain-containing protein [Candidatus Saccharibacteria bacterium]|nr:GatB/YqeY domain-containing protein [Candidatus Saccharibacteria bacterium]
MSLLEQINADFKAAMLARDDFTKVTLNGLKSAIKNQEIAKGVREQGLSEQEIQDVIAKEAKSRADAIALYQQAGDTERADKESRERDILMQYLPKQLSTEEIKEIVLAIIAEGGYSAADFGKVMGVAKSKIGNAAEGSVIANVVKECLNK